MRSISSCSLSVLRAIEENLISRKPENLTVKCHPEVAFYVLNEKRDHLLAIETNYGISIFLSPSHEVKSSQATIERGGERALPARRVTATPVMIDSAYSEADSTAEEEVPQDAEVDEEDIPLMKRPPSARAANRTMPAADGGAGADDAADGAAESLAKAG